MAKTSVKVETDQLKACAAQYKSLAEQFKGDWDTIEAKLKECKTYWQGSFASDIDDVLKKIKNTKDTIYNNTIDLSDFIDNAANLYLKYNGDIARAIREDPKLKAEDYPNNVTPSVHVKSKEELDDIYSKATKRADQDYKHNDNGSISCAAMTKSKAIENGFIPDWNGNGKDVVNNIYEGEHVIRDKNTGEIISQYNVTKYSGENCLEQLINAEGQPVTDIVVSFPCESGGGTNWGHVIYIDQIVDGKVYYSDNWVGRDGTDTRKGMECTIEEFLSRYYRYNKCKPSGCAHFKKSA